MGKKYLTTEILVKKFKEVHGNKYIYDKVEYTGANNKVCITCNKHGDFWMLPFAHLKGQECPKCKGRGLTNDEVIKRFMEVHGDEYDYSKVEYRKSSEKVIIICKEHGEFEQTPQKHLNGQGCPLCGNKKSNENRKTKKEEFIERARNVHGDKYDYSLIPDVFTQHDKVDIICPVHGVFKQLAYDHLHGHGCTQCAIDASKGNLEEFIDRSNEIHNNKYDYSNVVYVNSYSPVKIICPTHGEFEQDPGTHLKGCGCPICGRIISTKETEIYDYVCSLMGKENVIKNARGIIPNREIDIYVPSLKIGIEFNGVWWHSTKFGKDKKYHYDKMMSCNDNGIKLYQVFEDEYWHKKDIVLSKIKYLLGCSDDLGKVYARKCHIKQLKPKEAQNFLDKNHIQGFSKASVHLGLYSDDKNVLVSVMSFLKGEGKWELVRFATKINYICCGTGGKLFKYFVSKYNPNEIKSFADRRWTQNEADNIYVKLGFRFDGYVGPDYRYVRSGSVTRMHKFGFRKSRIHKKYGLPTELTETEMTEKLGFFKIYDCGLIRYVWKKEN